MIVLSGGAQLRIEIDVSDRLAALLGALLGRGAAATVALPEGRGSASPDSPAPSVNTGGEDVDDRTANRSDSAGAPRVGPEAPRHDVTNSGAAGDLRPAATTRVAPCAGAPETGQPFAAPDAKGPPRVWTAERNAILREHWPRGTPTDAIRALLGATQGAPLPAYAAAIASQAGYLKLHRPAGHAGAWRRAGRAPAAPASPAAATQAETRLPPVTPAPVLGVVVKSTSRSVPPLPPPGPDGKIAATFETIRDWARAHRAEYDGGNLDLINRLRGTAPPFVQVESRLAGAP